MIPELPAGKRVFIRRRASFLTSEDQANQEIELFIIPVWANADHLDTKIQRNLEVYLYVRRVVHEESVPVYMWKIVCTI